jgi:interleukin-1 receptor-associated kinase 1
MNKGIHVNRRVSSSYYYPVDSEKQFHNECIKLMRLQRQNIMRLVGYSDETNLEFAKYDGKYVFADENERALCFEYLLGGILEKHVSSKIMQYIDNVIKCEE